MKNVIKHKESEYVISFLKYLNDLFSIVKMQILIMDPLLTLKQAFSLVLLYES